MNTQAPARSIDRAQSHHRPACTTIPCPSAPAATDTRDHRPLAAVARYRKLSAHRHVDRLWLDLIVFLVCVGALISVAVGAPITATAAAIQPATGVRMPDAVSAQDSVIPLYAPEAGGDCSLAVNPVLLGSEARRAQFARSTQEASDRVLEQLKRTKLTQHAGAGGTASAADGSKFDPMTFVSGPPTLRIDSEGRYLLRIGFLATDKALARFGRDTLERDARAAVVETNAHFAASKLPTVFEYATLERYAGVLDEASASLTDLHIAATAPNQYSQGWVAGNYDALLEFRARNAVNLAVLLATPTNSGAYGVTDRGIDSFEFSSFLIALDAGKNESLTTVAAPTLTHEIGHSLSQRHGVTQDLEPYGLDADPEEVIRYRLSTNFAYGSGALIQDASGAGVQSMMTLGWYHRGTVFPLAIPVFVPQFSDPTVSLLSRTGTGAMKAFPLGRIGLEDSVKAIRQDARSFAIASTPMLAAWRVPVVEFYNVALNQYFMTADSEQIDLLDRLGEVKTGWKRTGESMNAVSRWGNWWKVSNGAYPEPPKAVARFYGSPSGPNTHFYSARIRSYCGGAVNPATSVWEAATCEEDLLRRIEIANPGNPNVLHYEGRDFRTYWYVDQSVPASEPDRFVCTTPFPAFPNEAPMRPVWRLFNGENGTHSRADGSRIDGNHRYTSKPEIRQQMLVQGWKDEGVAWCERMFEGR